MFCGNWAEFLSPSYSSPSYESKGHAGLRRKPFHSSRQGDLLSWEATRKEALFAKALLTFRLGAVWRGGNQTPVWLCLLIKAVISSRGRKKKPRSRSEAEMTNWGPGLLVECLLTSVFGNQWENGFHFPVKVCELLSPSAICFSYRSAAWLWTTGDAKFSKQESTKGIFLREATVTSFLTSLPNHCPVHKASSLYWPHCYLYRLCPWVLSCISVVAPSLLALSWQSPSCQPASTCLEPLPPRCPFHRENFSHKYNGGSPKEDLVMTSYAVPVLSSRYACFL